MKFHGNRNRCLLYNRRYPSSSFDSKPFAAVYNEGDWMHRDKRVIVGFLWPKIAWGGGDRISFL